MVCLALLVGMCGCSDKGALSRIFESGKIVLITTSSPYTHYIYQNKRAGFEYDLALAFADYLGVELEVITPEPDSLLQNLEIGRGDFIGANFHQTPSMRNMAAFSDPYVFARQHLVVHIDNRSIKTPEDLKGKTVHVPAGGAALESLRQLRDSGIEFHIKARHDRTFEQLISMVGDKQINITVADSRIVGLCQRYYPETRTAFAIGSGLPVVWVADKKNQDLINAMNRFLIQARNNRTIKSIHNRYFGDGKDIEYLDVRRFHNRLRSRLPRYQEIIEFEAKQSNMDWRLIAAIMYQESHFNPFAVSYTGVRGLMQVTQTTAAEMGIQDRLDPRQNIRAGTKYVRRLMQWFPEVDEPDQMRLALAAYNVGYGHVRDAMRIAEKIGLNPHQWTSVEYTLPLLRKRKYHKHSQHGYCRGTEPVRFVNGVMTYYGILIRKAMVL